MQLTVPNRTPPGKDAFDSRQASVRQWVEALPLANVGETSRLLYQALEDLNRQDIPAQQRFRALEALHEPVRLVTEHMKKHFVGKPLPPDHRDLKIAHLSRAITLSLATGYKILVMEQIAGVGRRDRKLLMTSVHRAMRLLGLVLLKAFQVYESPPQGVWLEIHSLYRFAEGLRLHSQKIPDPLAADPQPTTIGNLYRQILLLALACPYRMRQNEAEQVYLALEKWARHCELNRIEKRPEALFVTNLDRDEGPAYLVLRNTGCNPDTMRTVETQRLSEHIRKALAEPRASGLRTSTLRHLMLVWGVMPKRRYSRVRNHAQAVVTMGLSALHYFISGEVIFNQPEHARACPPDLVARQSAEKPRIQEAARFSARNPAGDGATPDVWEMNYRLEGETPPSDLETAVARVAAGPVINTSFQTQRWKMVNVSAGGYCLLWDNLETTRAQVGELIGIREQNDPDSFHWRLGVIRWLKFAKKHGLELGIQMLSPSAVAIAGRRDGRGHKNDDYTRGLLLPEIANIQQHATLLLPSPPFRVGDSIVVNCYGRNVGAELTRLVENTGSFAQFQFRALGEVDQPGRRKTGKDDDRNKSDFDDVWELL
ncbi:MAG TPA: hypothetical protein ENJ79_01380 [Gammaproteobacteria bacterium]|nr:hypothetical protein [Gammaproteobacteria bacterium]